MKNDTDVTGVYESPYFKLWKAQLGLDALQAERDALAVEVERLRAELALVAARAMPKGWGARPSPMGGGYNG